MLEYVRTDAFVCNIAQRSYQKLVTYVTGRNRAANDVMALASLRTAGTPSHRGYTSRGPRGLAATLLAPPGVTDAESPMTVAGIPSGVPDGPGQAGVAYPNREASTTPPFCYICWTRAHRVTDCTPLTDKQRELVWAARNTFLRQRGREAEKPQDRPTTVLLQFDDL